MKNIKLMNKIAACGTDIFDRAEYNVGEDVGEPKAIMVRSAALHDMEFNPELLAIARCGAGVNNIPIDRCTEAGIVVFNTPGANANGVKELVICALMLASRDVIGGANWAETLTSDVAKSVEKGKSAFAGCELRGKTLGVEGEWRDRARKHRYMMVFDKMLKTKWQEEPYPKSNNQEY
jgi:D-3-phosphoglycerate dehydrogenase